MFGFRRWLLHPIARHLNHLEQRIMSALTDLQTEVAENKEVMGSAVILLQGLKTRLDEAIASGDPAALAALSAELDSNTNALAAAVQANTPTVP